ncbi:DNA polymerase III subunit beta [Phytomonospora sp. NPDC050363]|uniref:DNA polymerase III subunit beta n=1 Tax=Phytomonospora sp. NPDC050363 TaxID=3155642 RepID=UPI0033D53C71
MKARIEHEAFTEAVRWGTRNVPIRPTVPSLSCALIEAEGERLDISCFDYETSSRISVPATVAEPGRALVPGRVLADIARALPAERVEFSVEMGRARLVCGEVRFHLPTMPVEDYPTPPPMPAVAGVADAAAFSHAVAQTAVAAGRDDTLPVLTGIELALAERIGLAATDRYRMAVADLDWRPKHTAPAKALVPARTLAALAKSLGAVGGEVTIGANVDEEGTVGLIGFTAGERSSVSRVLDGHLPDLRALIALEYPTRLRVDTAALALAARRVSLVADRDARLRLIAQDGRLTVESGSPEGTADGTETIACEYEGEPLRLAFNPVYIAEALAAVDAPVTVFSVDAAGQRVLVTGERDGGGDAGGGAGADGAAGKAKAGKRGGGAGRAQAGKATEFRQLLRTLRWTE